MVTIEQKLALFSKLLQRSANDEFSDEMARLKQEYEASLQKNKAAVDREAEEILGRFRKKAETEKIELVSKVRFGLKKEYLALKEKYFNDFMDLLRKKIDSFILSENYLNYLFLMAEKLAEQDQFSDILLIYMTVRDIDKYSEGLKQQLYEAGKREVTFRQAGDSIIGGFIAEEPAGSIRINLSIEALLEDNKPYIMQTLFQTIETGEAYGV